MTAYGFIGGHRMAPNHRAEPLAHEITLRYRAQSMLTRNGIVPPLPSIEEARRIIARANKPRIRLQVTVSEPLRQSPGAASANSDANPSLRVAGVDDSHNNAGAGVSQAARMRVGAHRPFSGQTIDASPRVRGQDCYTSPTVRGLSGETPEHPHTPLPASPDACSRVRSGGAGRQFPVSKHDLPDMTPEQLEQWEAEMMGPF